MPGLVVDDPQEIAVLVAEHIHPVDKAAQRDAVSLRKRELSPSAKADLKACRPEAALPELPGEALCRKAAGGAHATGHPAAAPVLQKRGTDLPLH